jgi:hypothetical protein
MDSALVAFVEAAYHAAAAAADPVAAAAAINALQPHAAIHLDGHNGDSMIAAYALHPALLQV